MQDQVCRAARLVLFVLGFGCCARPAAAEGTYFSRETVLKTFFATSDKVTYKILSTSEHADRLRAALGEVPPKGQYVIFVAQSHGAVDGYAVIDEERGQHLPITLATQLSPGGAVVRTEVMTYREKYGDEIREARFRDQFVGRGPGGATAAVDDIVAISGASISSQSMARAVARAVALVDALRAASAGL